MTNLTPEMRKAFRLLGVSPDSDPATIRSAWKAMVRANHPDRIKGNKAEANRRLAEMNAAFDLVSAWSPADARAYASAQNDQRDEATARADDLAHKAEEARKAAQKRKAEEARMAEETARRQAAEMERQEAAKRAARAHQPKPLSPKAAMARKNFLAALQQLAPLSPSRDLGYI